jgi:hypothetical protein
MSMPIAVSTPSWRIDTHRRVDRPRRFAASRRVDDRHLAACGEIAGRGIAGRAVARGVQVRQPSIRGHVPAATQTPPQQS